MRAAVEEVRGLAVICSDRGLLIEWEGLAALSWDVLLVRPAN